MCGPKDWGCAVQPDPAALEFAGRVVSIAAVADARAGKLSLPAWLQINLDFVSIAEFSKDGALAWSDRAPSF
jgi:hypothetical protein